MDSIRGGKYWAAIVPFTIRAAENSYTHQLDLAAITANHRLDL